MAAARPPERLSLADAARARGAAVVAITASQSPLARKADTVLALDPVEGLATQVPMISRSLQLLSIDTLTAGVALRRLAQGSAEAAAAPALKAPAKSPCDGPPPIPGFSTASPLARMTLHSR